MKKGKELLLALSEVEALSNLTAALLADDDLAGDDLAGLRRRD